LKPQTLAKRLCQQDAMDVHSPEFRLLLACVTRRATPGTELETLLGAPIDWAALEKMATWHGVFPKVARRLRARPEVPPEVAERFGRATFDLASRNLLFVSELNAICAAFHARGIEAIPYKGVILSQRLYGSIDQRRIKDIDILVRRDQVRDAVRCLQELGYADDSGLSPRQLNLALTYLHEHSFVRGELGVDLHWAFTQTFVWPSLDLATVWQSLVPFAFFGREYKVLSPELTLTSLCIHSAQDDWTQLKMFVDIAAVADRFPNLDWRQAQAFAGDSHSRRSFHVALRLAEEHLGAVLPPEISAEIARDQSVQAIANAVFTGKWPSVENPILQPTQVRWLLFRSRAEGVRDRVRFLSGVTFGLTIADFLRLGAWPAPLARIYFLLRPFRILSTRIYRYISTLFHKSVPQSTSS
jgi:hypothetical protein